jgi:hypothetical protein
MSTAKSLNEQKQELLEFHRQRIHLIESGELQKMIDEHEHWSKRLPLLKAEIDAILEASLRVTEPSKGKENGKTNRPKKSAQDVLKEMVDLLEKHPEGMKKADIAKKLNVGNPKVDEAFALDQSRFEPRMRGPKAVIKLKA